jgi:hypothetical protein
MIYQCPFFGVIRFNPWRGVVLLRCEVLIEYFWIDHAHGVCGPLSSFQDSGVMWGVDT